MNVISVRNARIHNLRHVDVDVPKGKFVLITGVSGSGKSSFAFDLLFEEGRRRYLQSLGYEPRVEEEDDFDSITGLPPTIGVEQRTLRLSSPRSVVGTRTRLYDLLRVLYSLAGDHPCPACGALVGVASRCPKCSGAVQRLPASAFSFNSPSGMCLNCYGRGYVVDLQEDQLVADDRRPLVKALAWPTRTLMRGELHAFAAAHGFSLDTPFRDLPAEVRHATLHGSDQCEFLGVINYVRQFLASNCRSQQERHLKAHIERGYCGRSPCPACGGFRLSADALAVTLGGQHIGRLGAMSIKELAHFLGGLRSAADLPREGKQILKAILTHLQLLCDVGLSHLTLLRELPSLSGGEQTRLFFVAHLDCGLNSVAYIFDEPTVGLHEREKGALLKALKSLTARGHTVIVVEHDPNLIRAADHIIDFGPGGGREGGHIVYQGDYAGLIGRSSSVTGRHLRQKVAALSSYRPVTEATPRLVLRGARTHNLCDLTVAIPLKVIVGVAGVSGSGKSSLITDTLVPLLRRHIEEDYFEELSDAGPPTAGAVLEGWERLKRWSVVSQAPIGRSRKSNPATYSGLWDAVRNLFARQTLARDRGLTAGHFSFNSEHGACPACGGEGIRYTPVGFGTVFTSACAECQGSGFRAEVLEVRYRERSIRDVLLASVEEARQIFADEPTIRRILDILARVGLGYLTLGQPAPTLSGGESQRLKLARELGRRRKTGTLYILDEPTTGLSYADSLPLLQLLNELADQGHSIIVIEHDPVFLSACDWLIELGPGGGDEGGRLIAQGPPSTLRLDPASKIGPFLEVAL